METDVAVSHLAPTRVCNDIDTDTDIVNTGINYHDNHILEIDNMLFRRY